MCSPRVGLWRRAAVAPVSEGRGDQVCDARKDVLDLRPCNVKAPRQYIPPYKNVLLEGFEKVINKARF